jgi:hypothetical protein
MRFNPSLRYNEKKTFISSDATESYQVIEASKENYATGHQKVLAMARNNFPSDIDISWLPAAAQTYEISPNINDYLIIDVAAVTVDIPNRNLQAFPYEEISYFDSSYGKMVYQTFTGKPSCKDHKNEVEDNPDLAKGVIFAAVLQYVPEFDIHKIRLLQGYDRTKDQTLVRDIYEKKRKYYSMGSLVSNFVCPVCGEIESQVTPCTCFKQGKGSKYMDNLIYQLCLGTVFIENSSVTEPADPFAEGMPF